MNLACVYRYGRGAGCKPVAFGLAWFDSRGTHNCAQGVFGCILDCQSCGASSTLAERSKLWSRSLTERHLATNQVYVGSTPTGTSKLSPVRLIGLGFLPFKQAIRVQFSYGILKQGRKEAIHLAHTQAIRRFDSGPCSYFASVAQLADAMRLERIQCEFESHPRYYTGQ